jgi:hypothetical protein
MPGPVSLTDGLHFLGLTQLGFKADALRLGLLAFGDVAQIADEDGPVRSLGYVDGQFRGELAGICTHRSDLDTFAKKGSPAVLQIALYAPGMGLAMPGGDDQVGESLAQYLDLGEIKGLFRRRVELDDQALLVHTDDAVEGRFDGGAQAAFTLVPGLFPLFAVGDLTTHREDALGSTDLDQFEVDLVSVQVVVLVAPVPLHVHRSAESTRQHARR